MERLLAAASVDERFRVLDRELLAWSRGNLELDTTLAFVLDRLVKVPGESSIRAATFETSTSLESWTSALACLASMAPRSWL